MKGKFIERGEQVMVESEIAIQDCMMEDKDWVIWVNVIHTAKKQDGIHRMILVVGCGMFWYLECQLSWKSIDDSAGRHQFLW